MLAAKRARLVQSARLNENRERERQRKEERETDRREEIRLARREQGVERVNECEKQNKRRKR